MNTVVAGRIAGFRVSVHWSVVAVLALLTWTLAEAVLPQSVEGRSTPAYWLFAGAGGVLFLSSLLAHELAHAWTARRHGVAVDGITLWLFGGVAQLRSEATTPQAELRIAAAGPTASLACAMAFALVAGTLSFTAVSSLAAGMLAWLAGANVVLAVFNLIPGAPLDGGRILRALLWKRHGDRLRATLTATRAGRIAGGALITLGFVELFVGANGGGLWTALIGWFVLNAARLEAEQALADDALRGVLVRDVMSPGPDAVPGWVSLHAFLHEYALPSRSSSFPVEDLTGRVTGLVTLSGMKAEPAERWPQLTVEAVMVPIEQVPVAAPGDLLTKALAAAGASRADGRLLVMDGDRVVGMVSPSDVAWALEQRMLAGGPRSDTSSPAQREVHA